VTLYAWHILEIVLVLRARIKLVTERIHSEKRMIAKILEMMVAKV